MLTCPSRPGHARRCGSGRARRRPRQVGREDGHAEEDLQDRLDLEEVPRGVRPRRAVPLLRRVVTLALARRQEGDLGGARVGLG